ncbi:hypothetical protein FGO68_gene10861 [Halteria grandinella]|uniref:Uncharacterized protein n=1 Tax=Halteria grandinella TaxID=5974 RepID=A0A8J8NVG9_HALGN|nr:hypothetical protein FGO68_gene10861 [Halteria grandinella]
MEDHVALRLSFPNIKFHFTVSYLYDVSIDIRLAYLALNLKKKQITPINFDNAMVNAQALVYNTIGGKMDPLDAKTVKDFLDPYLAAFQSHKERVGHLNQRPLELRNIYDFHPNILKVILSDINNFLRMLGNMRHEPKYTLETAEKIFELQMKSGLKEMLIDGYQKQIKTEMGMEVNPGEEKISYQEYYQRLFGNE